jgi:hypothetical protein
MIKNIAYYHGALAAIDVPSHAAIVRDLIAELEFEIDMRKENETKALADKKKQEIAKRIADDATQEAFDSRSYEKNRYNKLNALTNDQKLWLTISETAREKIGGMTLGESGVLKIDNDWKRTGENE